MSTRGPAFSEFMTLVKSGILDAAMSRAQEINIST
jgi:hypothetical protein